MKEQFVPFDNVSSSRIHFSVSFPEYVDKGRVGVNVARIESLCRLGGISHLDVIGKTDGYVSEHTPTIVGYNNQGNAYMAKTGSRKEAGRFTSFMDGNFIDDNLYFFHKPHAASWTNGRIELNMNEISQTIQRKEQNKTGIRNTEEWSHYLNEALRKGIVSIGVNHLLFGLDKTNRSKLILQFLIATVFEAGLLSGNPHAPCLESSLQRAVIVSMCLNIFDYALFHNAKDRYRWSLIYGIQPDRALLLTARTVGVKLVKELEPSTQIIPKIP